MAVIIVGGFSYVHIDIYGAAKFHDGLVDIHTTSW